MLKRAIALSLALVFGLGVLLPFATNEAEAGSKKSRKYRKHRKHYKKYSKRWWRQYRARQRRMRARSASVRQLRLRQLRLAKAQENAGNDQAVAASNASAPAEEKAPRQRSRPAKGWNETASSHSEMKFRIDDSAGSQVGSASISVVGPANIDGASVRPDKALGGVPTTSLRRDVINKMIQENGWVVNDYQKMINGRPVYVVVAQSQAKNGQVQSRMFYFAEVDGRIYNVATNAAADQADRLAEESEKVLGSIQSRVQQTTLRASTREE